MIDHRNMIEWRQLDGIGLFEAVYSGVITEAELVANAQKFFAEAAPDSSYFILEDGRQATYNLPRDINHTILGIVQNHIQKFRVLRVAFVQDKPKETAINVMFEHLIAMPNYRYRVFTTREVALDWLITEREQYGE